MVTDARHRLATVRKLPYDAEIEYLESTGTQYALYPDSVTLGNIYDFETRVACFNPTTSPYSGFGATGRYTRQAFLAFNVSSGAYLGFAYTPTNDFGKHLVDDATTPHTYKASFENGIINYYADGMLKHTVANGSGFVITSFGLFKMRDIESNIYWVNNALVGRIYYCKLQNEDKMAFDLIPVRFTNELGQSEGAMYDKVSGGLFRNQGSGEFVMGPDVIPYDAEVEYLESTGTQYIDLGINSASGYTFDMKLRLSPGTASGEHYIVGGSDSPNRLYFGVWGNTWMIGYGSYYRVGSVTDETDYTIKLIRNVGTQRLVVNGVTEFNADSTSNINSSSPWRLFTRNVTSQNWNISAKLYYATVTQEGVGVVRDFIPVRIGTTGYMYDRANPKGGPLGNGLYPNSGSGDFILGKDVAYPKRKFEITYRNPQIYIAPPTARDYISDGLIAMWDGIENAGGGGQHDSNVTVWKDLAGNRDLVLGSAATVQDNYIATTVASPITVPSDEIDGVETIQVCVHRYGNLGTAVISVKRGQYIRIQQVDGIYNMYANGNTSTGYASHSIIGTVTKTEDVTLTTTGPWLEQNKFYQDDEDRTALGTRNWWRIRDGLVMGVAYGDNSERGSGGSIYSVRLYSRALTAEEIAHNYAIDKIRFNLP